MRKAITLWIAVLFLSAGHLCAAHDPDETRNAALRYWLAFAEMQDPPADKTTTELLEKTAAGDVVWNEAKLGPILDKNEEAILAMQRGTKLPECDWGLEYERGRSASIAYVARARVLARLNTLYGKRLEAKGRTQEAIDTWLAGIRFSRHLAQGGSLIFSLVGKMTLVSNLRALTQAVHLAGWSDAQRKEVQNSVRALPETGFDWGEALWHEESPLDIAAKQMAQARDPRAYYEELTGEPAPPFLAVPTTADTDAFHNIMDAAAATLQQPPDLAEDRLRALQESVKTLHPFYRRATPSFTKINEARTEVRSARAALLSSVMN
jgi:hypothetical protein